jgi:hypothetical protein
VGEVTAKVSSGSEAVKENTDKFTYIKETTQK